MKAGFVLIGFLGIAYSLAMTAWHLAGIADLNEHGPIQATILVACVFVFYVASIVFACTGVIWIMGGLVNAKSDTAQRLQEKP